MKKTITIFIAFIISSILSYAAFQSIENVHTFRVTMINQEPDPVAPGNFIDVRFRVENLKTEPMKNVEVKLVLKYPFSFYWEEDKIKSIGTLSGGQRDDIGVRVKFRLLTDKNAAEGENTIEFWYRIDGGAWRKAGDYNIEVRTRDAVLAINEIKTDSDILPGTKVSVKFRLENIADSVLKDIKLKLTLLESITTASSVTTKELPFTPIGSGNIKTIDKILPGKSEDVSFDLFIDADAESKAYKVPYILTYSDEIGTNFSISGIIGLIVDAEPDVSINLDSTDIYSVGTKGTVTVKFVNKGFSDIKFLDSVLQQSSDYDILSNPEVYIGNIDSDDYESAEYSLLIHKNSKSPVKLPLKVEYRDANGKLTKRDVELELRLFSGEALKQRMNGKNNSAAGILIVIIIVAGGIFVWRWRKRKKKQN